MDEGEAKTPEDGGPVEVASVGPISRHLEGRLDGPRSVGVEGQPVGPTEGIEIESSSPVLMATSLHYK